MEIEILRKLKNNAAKQGKTIVLPESHDERVLKAADTLTKEKIVSVVTIGNEEKIRKDAERLNVDLNGIKIVEQEKSGMLEKFSGIYYELRKKKGTTPEQAEETIRRDLFFGAMMVREGIVDGSVAGSTASTADVLRAGIQCIGMPEGILTVSSYFLMAFPEKTYTFSDCGVVPNPTSEQLADITISAAENHFKLTRETPVIALLSFSTKGSARDESIDKVLRTLAIVQKKRPDLLIDGELQFDSAVIESIGERKAPGSPVAGKANVLIFPDLNSGNIAYKITQRWGKAEAIGPLVQGLKKPFHDLSRGCSPEDIVVAAAIAALMSVETAH